MFLTTPKSYVILIRQKIIIYEYVNEKTLFFVDCLGIIGGK